MSWFNENIKEIEEGLNGEEFVRRWLTSRNQKYMQIDLMFKDKEKGKWYSVEVKTQEVYTPGKDFPFYGHGLPEWQIKDRMQLYRDTGIQPQLIVKEKGEDLLYIGNLVNLMKTDFYKTKGNSPRIIFKIEHFKKVKIIKI